MRTTLALADDVYEAAKTLAEASGRSLGEVVSVLARRGLSPQPVIAREGDFPVFAVPANAPIIPGNRASQLMADEGIDE
jgi:uncharacterized protein YggE